MFQEGDRVVTASRNGTKMWKSRKSGAQGALWCIGTYVARVRKADGVLTWRLESREGSYSVFDTAEKEAEAHAEAVGLPFWSGVTHGTVCNPVPKPQPVVEPEPEPEPEDEDLYDWCYGAA